MRKKMGKRRKEKGGRRKEEGERRKEKGGRRKEEVRPGFRCPEPIAGKTRRLRRWRVQIGAQYH
jgi:hypothetical protein